MKNESLKLGMDTSFSRVINEVNHGFSAEAGRGLFCLESPESKKVIFSYQ